MEPGALDRFDDEPKLHALIEMMVLAASADGNFSEEERKRLEHNVLTLTSERVDAARCQAILIRLQKRLLEEGREKRLAAVKLALGDRPARKVALDLALQVMAADGVLRTSERELILETAEALDIDRSDAADMVIAVMNARAGQVG